MKKTSLHGLGYSLVAAAAALLTACAKDAPLAPDRVPESAAYFPATSDTRAPELPAGCENLQVDAGSKLVFRAYATGVQIYRWNGTSWSFVGPSAVLSADVAGRSTVGTHYATTGGPAWESVSGSKVIGTVLERCTPDANSIPWLKLGAVSSEGPGIFARVAFILRVNTSGGTAPTDDGTLGELREVPYTTTYLFYR
jgi:hypothetical protein